jgi:hypothetical protein
MSLYSDDNPETTIHGYGYKDEKKARETIKLVESSGRDRRYQFNVINTMYYRAKHHKNQTEGMRKAMRIFERWLNKFRREEGKVKRGGEGKSEFSFLNLNLIDKYEKMAEYYNISRKARGLEKPTTSDKGFLVVYRDVKGNQNALKTIPVKANKPDGDNWYNKRESQVKAKYGQMKKMGIKLFHEDGKLKGLPTKMHVNMIMWAFSPEPEKLKKNIGLLKNI